MNCLQKPFKYENSATVETFKQVVGRINPGFPYTGRDANQSHTVTHVLTYYVPDYQ